MSDIEHSLQTYISDMLALEDHVRIPFETQLNDADLPKYPAAAAVVRRLSDLSNAHIQSLRSALEAAGGHEAHGTKSTVSSIEGWFAGAIDKMRKTKIAKALRDDYTALSLCTVSYSMLLATANAYGVPQVAQLAERHMRDYAEVIMEIGQAMPDVVVHDLQETGLPIASTDVAGSRAQIESVWRASAAGTEAALNRGASNPYPTA